jgi:hypothetical protein
MCDTDSFGSRLSGNGSAGIVGEFKHIKEEIENDEDYFRLLANQTRTMRHFDGKRSASLRLDRSENTFLHEKNIPDSFMLFFRPAGASIEFLSYSRYRFPDRSGSLARG